MLQRLDKWRLNCHGVPNISRRVRRLIRIGGVVFSMRLSITSRRLGNGKLRKTEHTLLCPVVGLKNALEAAARGYASPGPIETDRFVTEPLCMDLGRPGFGS
jgi:hypothetical protein